MEVILLEKIRNLGSLGEKVRVKNGYARNFLIPVGKAVYATEQNIEKFEKRRAELETKAAERHEQAIARQKGIEALGNLTITVKAGEEGKLFGSIGTRDIAESLINAGFKIEKKEIRLPMGTLRYVGDYDITVELDSDVTATIKVHILPEGGSSNKD